MPAPRLSMRKTREILRLRLGLGLSLREVARSCDVSSSTVSDCIGRAAVAGLGWPLPAELDDAGLEAKLYPADSSNRNKATPDFQHVHRELRRKGVTLELLWQEYRALHPEGYGYSRFCDLYRDFSKSLDVVMRQSHAPGEKLFVDFAGMKLAITDPQTGEVHDAEVFVAAMGASSFTYAEALPSQELRHWLSAHVHAFEYLGGVPRVTVPDNLKAGVTKPSFYDPEINRSYQDLAEFYGTVVIPTRVRKPRDKSKVENAVQQVERWVLAPLRNQRFFSFSEANREMLERLAWLNNRPLSKLDGTRRMLFEQLDKPALGALPAKRFELPEWKSNVGVNIDYHIEFDRHYYSVPYALVRKRVDVRATDLTIECFHQGQRVASHPRSFVAGKHSTLPEHRPRAHRHFAEWSPSRLIRWASTVGPGTADVVRFIIENKRHPEQGYRSALGVIRLAGRYGKERVEQASLRAAALHSMSYATIHSLLKTGLERQPMATTPSTPLPEHDNVRGPDYYNR
jgi:transposase